MGRLLAHQVNNASRIHPLPARRHRPARIQRSATDRFFLKSERKEPECFTLFFSGGDEQLPVIRGLNFDEHDAFLTETSERNDTVTYWLRDTTLVNQDTLRMEVQYMMTDSTGVLVSQLVSQTDTLEVLSKTSYEKRLKDREKAFEQWKKEQEKRQKRGEKFETEMSGKV